MGEPSLQVCSPIPGRLVGLRQVPDLVFSGMIVGAGIAVRPLPGAKKLTAVAPISGRLIKLFPHAFMIANGEQTVLVHLGIDTVKMRGDGFTCHALENEMVKAGDPITTFSVKQIEKARYSPICPVVVLDSTPSDLENLRPEGNQVEVGDLLFEISAAPAGDPSEW
ncbi:PTS glucose transporter subunit IIA [uncultured Varibaculum sp.]|uniref:PTS sugar transporter subunit IIA n=1 Tax=uncultured Varibaculum sp. TaxID=413896 RepID=UPI0025973AEE|nr:PTS glucose transporter subunit IIA [uncultured Varibaculum sp.]